MITNLTTEWKKAIKLKTLILRPSPEIDPSAPGHAKLGPSSADRWMTCSGAPQMEAHFENGTSEYAAEGSAAHYVREQCLVEGKEVREFIGQEIEQDGFKIEVTPDWERHLEQGLEFTRQQIGLLYVEYRVDLSYWLPGEFGTLDTGLVTEDEIIIKDFKFGRGVKVDAYRLKQLIIYAAGLWENEIQHIKGAPTTFRLIVDQPRMIGGWTEYVCELEEILTFMEEASEAAEKTKDPDAELVASLKACAFCSAAQNVSCPAYAEFVIGLLGLNVEELDNKIKQVPDMPSPEKLSPERRSYIIHHRSMISGFINRLSADALNDATKGLPVPHFKAVATLGDRQWVDDKEAEEFWLEKMPAKDIYNKKLKSPAQMEVIAGTRNWKKAETYFHRPEGRPALVPESDPRPPLANLADLLDDGPDELDELLGIEQTSLDDYEDLI